MLFQTYELLTMSNQPFFGSATVRSFGCCHPRLHCSGVRQEGSRLRRFVLVESVGDRLVDHDLTVVGDRELETLHGARRGAFEVGRDDLPTARISAVTRAVAGALELILGVQIPRRTPKVRADGADGDEAIVEAREPEAVGADPLVGDRAWRILGG